MASSNLPLTVALLIYFPGPLKIPLFPNCCNIPTPFSFLLYLGYPLIFTKQEHYNQCWKICFHPPSPVRITAFSNIPHNLPFPHAAFKKNSQTAAPDSVERTRKYYLFYQSFMATFKTFPALERKSYLQHQEKSNILVWGLYFPAGVPC